MQVGVTLTPEEFTKLHNALCHLSNSANAVAQLGHEKDAEAIAEEVEVIRALLKPAYDADEKEFTKRLEHFRAEGAEFDAATAWSMYEVEDLNTESTFPEAKSVTYKSHWGGHTPVVPLTGTTWLHLFIAADAAIRQSGDMHHIYIEAFTQEGDTLILHTGS